jgi:hypothetical protein
MACVRGLWLDGGACGCMNIGSVLYRLSPVQGTYRSINHESYRSAGLSIT